MAKNVQSILSDARLDYEYQTVKPEDIEFERITSEEEDYESAPPNETVVRILGHVAPRRASCKDCVVCCRPSACVSRIISRAMRATKRSLLRIRKVFQSC